MNRALSLIGLALTVIYGLIVCWLIWGRIGTLQTMDLNEVGDFLAGVFGPVAILWLILGYFQQGMELQQNNKALQMQADELRNSVEQQTAMAESQRLSLKHNERTLEPLLELNVEDVFYDGDEDGEFRAFRLTNLGEYCERVFILMPEDECHWMIETLSAGETINFSVRYGALPFDTMMTISIRYTTRAGVVGLQEFSYTEYRGNRSGVRVSKRPFINS
ncbi:hypothetical protein [Pseudomonas sp. PDM19]|uniref:hypothetical protein n=1 Tax=Pseudomonas sp. PDM19 TaxID=2769272 RepID=UPI00177DF680|nr:hypothetical protein [Pseudomonas sp. PDM19]MBD9629786.1 hypothetical protein [Pseudomonas sp. PDM19]